MAAYRDDAGENGQNKKKKGLGWLWLIPLLLIPLLLWALLRDDNSADTTRNNSTDTSQTAQTSEVESGDDTNQKSALRQKYETTFNTEARTIYFNPDTTAFQDEAGAAAKLDAIAVFAKENPAAKLQVNGSIFDEKQVDSASNLAKQRAELVKTRLVEKGVADSNVSVSTENKYEGQDEAARAMYARSVDVTVKE